MQALFILIIIPSIVLHEVSHGYVAYLFGDPTAKDAHRLTLNPLRHIDLFGTILLPVLLIAVGLPAFGYAKPVPVNIGRLRKPRQQALWVSLAGPAVNIVLSFIGFLLCKHAVHVTLSQSEFNVGEALGLMNLTLAAFNLLPIPPLDGSAIIERFIPMRSLPRYYQWRSRALPFLMIFIIVDSAFLHVGTNWLGDLQLWWLKQI
ncbi:MAG TPA: site-2 protease family protein [Acidimicrobiales bacterium]|nr:site-2 protease family protein [Acidimicrobiales bacterium]